MLLAIDVGNTNTVLGLYKLDGEKAELAANWRAFVGDEPEATAA